MALHRRKFGQYLLSSSLIATTGCPGYTNNAAYASESGLASKLAKRDASVLNNSVFNLPPSAQVYPKFMRGEWNVEMSFRGYLFPSTKIPKEQLTANVSIPGFQKCSIAQLSDIGKDRVQYHIKIDPETGYEDRQYNLQQTINAHLGYEAVEQVIYDVKSNPNRISIYFTNYRTRNAERIELFVNGRESELVSNPADEKLKVFVCSEYIRQVTFSYSQEFGIARQVVGNYAHFWTWRQQESENGLTGNVLTAAYLDPQDPMFFDEPVKPVVVYSHDLVATRML